MMKALIKRNPTIGVSLDNVPTPEYGKSDLLIRVLKTSLCGTDLQLYRWSAEFDATIPLPVIIGHEFVGEIVEIGSNVKGFSLGQYVSGETSVHCGDCQHCISGHHCRCENITYTGVTRPGAFAEFIALPAGAVWSHAPDIELETATLFEPLGNVVHALSYVDLSNKTVLILGASPEGTIAAAICRHAGACDVVVVDEDLKKLRLALAMGASHVVNVKEDTVDETRLGLGLEEGFDVTLELLGNRDAYPLVFNHTRQKGEVVLAGIPDSSLEMDWRSVIFKQLTIKGVHGRAVPETWQQMSALIEGGLDLSPIISKCLHYTEFEEGFNLLAQGWPGKVIMDWGVKK